MPKKSTRRLSHRPAVGTGPARELTSFIGRTAELTALRTAADSESALITVLGPPGVGKTRLVTRFLHESTTHSDAAFCDLRAASSRDGLLSTLSAALQIQVDGPLKEDGAIERIGRSLAVSDVRCLVLDNFEQLVELGREVVHRLLLVSPRTQVVATSRRPLGLPGEWLLDLSPLPTSSGIGAQESDAARLFFDRAASVEPRITPDSAHADDVRQLVRRLEGIPLAIELAASQLRRRTPRELLDQWSVAIGQATGVEADDTRHWTLNAAIGHSWKLLSSAERAALSQLTVFRGGFTLDAAVHVARAEGENGDESTVALVEALRASSLLRVEDGTKTYRWNLYEAVREFVALQNSELDEANGRHACFFADEGRRLLAQVARGDGREALASLNQELENLRSAFDWAVDRSPTVSFWLACTLHHVLKTRTPSVVERLLTRALRAIESTPFGEDDLESRTRIASLLRARGEIRRHLGWWSRAESDLLQATSLIPHDAMLQGELFHEQGLLAFAQGSVACARERLIEALAFAESHGQRGLEASIRSSLGWVLAEAFGDTEAFEHYRRAISIFQELGDQPQGLATQRAWNVHRVFFGRPAAADQLEEHILFAEGVGDDLGEARGWMVLGIFQRSEERLESAIEAFQRAATLARRAGMFRDEAVALTQLAATIDLAGRTEDAIVRYNECLEKVHARSEVRLEAMIRLYLSGALSREGDPARARIELDRASALLTKTGDQVLAEAVRIQELQLLAARARVAAASGDLQRSETLWDELEAQASRLGIGARTEVDRRQFTTDVVMLVARLLRKSLCNRGQTRPTLCIWEDGSGFRLGQQGRVSLDRGPLLRRLLRTLARQRVQAPGVALSQGELLERCWPGERMSHDSGSIRVRDNVRRLRRAGMTDVLLGSAEGYYLDPTIPVTVVADGGAAGLGD